MRRLFGALTWLRSVLFTLPLVYWMTIVLGAVGLLITPLDRQQRLNNRLARLWARLLLVVSGVRVRVRGLEHLEPGRQYLYLSNHVSYLDILVVFSALPAGFRIMAKASLFPLPFLGWYLTRAGHLPIAEEGAHTRGRSLRQAARHLAGGRSMLVFPEGGRSRRDGLEEFKPGIFWAAIRAGVPIVPVALIGAKQLQPLDTWVIRPGRVTVTLDAPIPTEDLGRDQRDPLIARVRQRIEDNLRRESGSEPQR